MIVDLESSVELERTCAVIDKLSQVVEPRSVSHGQVVLIAGLFEMRVKDRRALIGIIYVAVFRTFADLSLLFVKKIVIVAEPKAQLESHLAEVVEEGPCSALILLEPCGKVEAVVIPLFIDRGIVAYAHPLRLEPDHITRDSLAAEGLAVPEHLACVRLLVEDEGISVCEFGKHGRLSGNAGIEFKRIGDRTGFGDEDVKILVALRHVDKYFTGIGAADIVILDVCAVHEDSPAVRAHEIRDRSVGYDVLYVDTRLCSAASEALAALVTETEYSLTVSE